MTSGPYGNLVWPFAGYRFTSLSSTLMLAMYCPSIREQMVRQKQHLQHLLAVAPHLIPVTFGLLKDWNISGGIRTIFLCRLPRSMSRITFLQVEFAEQYVFCGERISLWLRECWPIVNATGLPAVYVLVRIPAHPAGK